MKSGQRCESWAGGVSDVSKKARVARSRRMDEVTRGLREFGISGQNQGMSGVRVEI